MTDSKRLAELRAFAREGDTGGISAWGARQQTHGYRAGERDADEGGRTVWRARKGTTVEASSPGWEGERWGRNSNPVLARSPPCHRSAFTSSQQLGCEGSRMVAPTCNSLRSVTVRWSSSGRSCPGPLSHLLLEAPGSRSPLPTTPRAHDARRPQSPVHGRRTRRPAQWRPAGAETGGPRAPWYRWPDVQVWDRFQIPLFPVRDERPRDGWRARASSLEPPTRSTRGARPGGLCSSWPWRGHMMLTTLGGGRSKGIKTRVRKKGGRCPKIRVTSDAERRQIAWARRRVRSPEEKGIP